MEARGAAAGMPRRAELGRRDRSFGLVLLLVLVLLGAIANGLLVAFARR